MPIKIEKTTLCDRYETTILHIGKYRFSGCLHIQTEYDGNSGISVGLRTVGNKIWRWRDEIVLFSMHIEVKRMKLYLCRFDNSNITTNHS